MKHLLTPGFLYLSLLSLLATSCGTSKNALIQSQTSEIATLERQNSALKAEVTALERKLQETRMERNALRNEVTRLQTELDEMEGESERGSAVGVSNESISSSAYPRQIRKFLEGGAELPLDVTKRKMSQVIATARTFIGTKYRNGGTSRSGVDCSGLLYACFQDAGVGNLPRTAENFARHGKLILAKENLREGDLVFFTKTYNTPRTVTHAGIYLGNGKFIHASSSKGVIISDIYDPYYWGDKYIFGTRLTN
jgi:cell wall-associated NlpC family hydrolase